MDTIIHHTSSINTILLLQISIKARFNVIKDWFPAIIMCWFCNPLSILFAIPFFVIYKITKSRCIHHCQSQLDTILFQICCCGLNFHCLGCFMGQFHIFFRWIQSCIEKSIDQCRLAETRFTYEQAEFLNSTQDPSLEPSSYSFSLVFLPKSPLTPSLFLPVPATDSPFHFWKNDDDFDNRKMAYQQPCKWIESPFWLTSDVLGWVDWQIQHNLGASCVQQWSIMIVILVPHYNYSCFVARHTYPRWSTTHLINYMKYMSIMNVNKEKESAYPWYLSIKRKRNKRKKKGEILKILLLKGCAGPKGIKQE